MNVRRRRLVSIGLAWRTPLFLSSVFFLLERMVYDYLRRHFHSIRRSTILRTIFTFFTQSFAVSAHKLQITTWMAWKHPGFFLENSVVLWFQWVFNKSLFDSVCGDSSTKQRRKKKSFKKPSIVHFNRNRKAFVSLSAASNWSAFLLPVWRRSQPIFTCLLTAHCDRCAAQVPRCRAGPSSHRMRLCECSFLGGFRYVPMYLCARFLHIQIQGNLFAFRCATVEYKCAQAAAVHSLGRIFSGSSALRICRIFDDMKLFFGSHVTVWVSITQLCPLNFLPSSKYRYNNHSMQAFRAFDSMNSRRIVARMAG